MADTIPSSMRASQWTTAAGGLEKNLSYNANAPLPKGATSLPKNSTLVKVRYSSINPVDHKLPEAPLLGSLIFQKPATPGYDFAGTVVSTTLPDFQPGDRVFGKTDPPAGGTLGEYVVVSGKEGIAPLPQEASFVDGAGVGIAGLTAYQCIVPHVQEGSKVFINGGSGGTGTWGIQIAKAMGCKVTTTCSGPNVELCKSLGADEVIDYRTTDVVEHLRRQGTVYDLLVDNVNTPAIYWSAHDYLKPEGRYIAIAGDANLGTLISMAKMLLLPTWLGGGKRTAKFLMLASDHEQYKQMGEWIKQGKVKAVVEKTYELEEAAEAFAMLKTSRTRGKLIIKVAGE